MITDDRAMAVTPKSVPILFAICQLTIDTSQSSNYYLESYTSKLQVYTNVCKRVLQQRLYDKILTIFNNFA